MEDQANDVLIYILVGAFAITTLLAINATFDTGVTKKGTECEGPHQWSTNPETNQLQCTECNYVAGTNSSNKR